LYALSETGASVQMDGIQGRILLGWPAQIGRTQVSQKTAGTTLQLMCALAIRSPFDAVVVPDFEAAGHYVAIEWQPTTVIMKAIAGGQRADAVFVINTAMDELVAQGIVDPATRTEVVISRLGLGVRAGAPRPDISTAAAFRQALLNARSVAFSIGGASGIYFRELIAKMGIADEVAAKATTIPAGFTAEKLITGEADLAVQQISELLVVDGIEVIGPFPDEYQSTSAFSAAVFKGSPNRELAMTFLRSVRGPRAVTAYEKFGLELTAAG
jgi:molybdate transport system substrate-binding protein